MLYCIKYDDYNNLKGSHDNINIECNSKEYLQTTIP